MTPASSQPSPAAADLCGRIPSRPTLIAVLAILGAAWILAGGCGLLGRPFANGLAWCALAISCAAIHPNRQAGFRPWIVFAFGLVTAVLALASAADVVRLAGLAVFAASLSLLGREPASDRFLRMAAQAVAVLALYRFSLTSIPLVWHLSEMAGNAVGSFASAFWNRPLSVGASFAGLDHLVLMAALVAAWAMELERPRWRPVLLALAAVAIGQLLYLLCLSLAMELARELPVAPAETPPDLYVPPDWFWGDAARTWLPWNVPVLATVWHLAVVVAMLHLGSYRQRAPAATKPRDLRSFDWLQWAPVAAAALLPLVCVLSVGRSDLREKTILAYDKGYLDWDVPVHDRYGADSSGRFGMLPTFVKSLGGQLKRSSELTQEELAGADLLLLIHPNQPWSDELLARVHDYVRQGGSLLVAAGPHFQDATGASSCNDLLRPLGIPVAFDMAVSQTEVWRHAMQVSTHPATLGLGDDRDRFGMSAAASIRLPWRASPLLVGRWGWSDPGSDFFLTGRTSWDAGERLGDLVLAAEQTVGRGRVVVLGDNGCLTNQGNVRAYRFTGRLLSYLAQKAMSPQVWWRQLAALALTLGLIVLWTRSSRSEMLAVSLLTLLLVATLTAKLSCRFWEVLPDGRSAAPNNLAYIDACHLEAYSESSWSPDGADGLALTLMRDGYLALAADDLSSERLRRAGMLVSIAPARHFTMAERTRIRQFVEAGGILIAMAGAEHGQKVNAALEQFGFQIPSVYHRPGSNQADARPLGGLYRPYPDGQNSLAPVVFHAAWSVNVNRFDRTTTSIVSTEGPGNTSGEPIVASLRVGQGVAIVIGDTGFALNKTLENQDGGSLSGDRVNAHFWRWLIGQLPNHKPWLPPPYDWDALKTQQTSTPARDEEAQP